MLGTLHRYIFRELLRVFLFAVVGLTLILSLGSILQPVQEYGVGPKQVVHLMGYFLPITLTFVLPMAALFAGALISRMCLEKMKNLGIDFSGEPYSMNEMRLPTTLSALGFKCGRLNFPFVRYRPEWSEREIWANQDAGIFHPVKKALSVEMKTAGG